MIAKAKMPNSAFAVRVPILLAITNDADNASNRTDNAVAVPIVSSTGIPESIPNAVANKPIATVMTISVPIDEVILLPILTMSANIPIRTPIAAVALKSSDVSINDNTAIAAAITPIATAIAIRLPLHSLASLVARIISAIIDASIPTATIPLAKCCTFMKPSIVATTARRAIDIDIINNVDPTPLRSLPASSVAAINPTIIALNALIAIRPFTKSPGFMPPMIRTVSAMSAIAAAIPNSVDPIFVDSLEYNLVAAISPTMTHVNAIIVARPITNSSGFILDIILTTTVSNSIAPAIPISVEPTLVASLAYKCVIASKATNT